VTMERERGFLGNTGLSARASERENGNTLSRRFFGERANIQSCKLIPVLLLNVILYRRRFSPHKYLVVSLVTVGISMFMFFGPTKKKGGQDSAWGLGLLVIKYVSVSALDSNCHSHFP